jgi:hypothetical protein
MSDFEFSVVLLSSSNSGWEDDCRVAVLLEDVTSDGEGRVKIAS